MLRFDQINLLYELECRAQNDVSIVSVSILTTGNRIRQEMLKIVALTGSARCDASNESLFMQAAPEANTAGAEVTSTRRSDSHCRFMRLIGDPNMNSRTARKRLKALLTRHQGLLSATPERSGGYTALVATRAWRIRWPLYPDTPGAAHQAFSAQGSVDANVETAILGVGAAGRNAS